MRGSHYISISSSMYYSEAGLFGHMDSCLRMKTFAFAGKQFQIAEKLDDLADNHFSNLILSYFKTLFMVFFSVGSLIFFVFIFNRFEVSKKVVRLASKLSFRRFAKRIISLVTKVRFD